MRAKIFRICMGYNRIGSNNGRNYNTKEREDLYVKVAGRLDLEFCADLFFLLTWFASCTRESVSRKKNSRSKIHV
jgi:hypothetical protein